jgi:hypothetical protein
MDKEFKGILAWSFFGVGLFLIFKVLENFDAILERKIDLLNPISYPNNENTKTDIKPKVDS